MVKIRLTRTGRKHQAHYRIVAVEARSKRDGKYIDQIGYYNPRTKPTTVQYDKEKLLQWIANGAVLTDTVHDLFVREGVIKQTTHRKKQIESIVNASKQRKASAETSATESDAPESPADETAEKEQKETDEEKPVADENPQDHDDPTTTSVSKSDGPAPEEAA
ncbi:MAG: 30S ribosomal protein S16 [Candidatus Dojkabacteria bacterium]|nr:30S ribosomal protein S16 [Candidatus Dojkabacteria bacterium]